MKRRARRLLRRAQIICGLLGAMVTFTVNEIVLPVSGRSEASPLDWCTLYLWALLLWPSHQMHRAFGLPWPGDATYGTLGFELWLAAALNAFLFLAAGTIVFVCFAKVLKRTNRLQS